MFHPIGPNLRLSWMMAWKKQKLKSNFLYSVGFWHPLNSYSVNELYERNKFARRPWGGYKVIFTPFCRTEIGKEGVGIDVNHNLKSGLVASPNYSTSFSNDGIHDADKWQFWSKIHVPFASAALTNCSALPPWPWPREID